MKKSIIIISLGIILLALAGCSNQNNNAIQTSVNEDNIIEITASGFNPSTLNINAGETVTWINKELIPGWPASAVHPTHTVYPGSSIEKCGTGELIFDACKNLKQGETFSFTFNEKGTWRYHNHLDPGNTGTIIIQ